jgi:fructose/tagatose bisphosphate aldolase
MSKSKFYLGIGPMSVEIIETVNEYTSPDNTQLMLICSENQVNRDGGYTGLTTKEFSKLIHNTDVWKCRDHCGPRFFYRTKQECFDTIIDDINNGFELIHIDNCWLDGEEKLQYTLEAIELALSINSNIKFEIGTEVNTVNNKLSSDRLQSYLDEILKLTTPFFYVLETGSVVQGYNNTHKFDICDESVEILNNASVKIKEHNADYINKPEIRKRYGIINGMNIAPQFGVVQTSTVLNEAMIYGIDTTEFKYLVYHKNKWNKWKEDNRKVNLDYATLLAGHYHFNTNEYKSLIDKLSKYVNIKHNIKNNIKKIIDYYISSYWSSDES